MQNLLLKLTKRLNAEKIAFSELYSELNYKNYEK